MTTLLGYENKQKKEVCAKALEQKRDPTGISLLQESHQITTKFHYFPDLGVTERSGSRDNIFNAVRWNFVSNRESLPLTS